MWWLFRVGRWGIRMGCRVCARGMGDRVRLWRSMASRLLIGVGLVVAPYLLVSKLLCLADFGLPELMQCSLGFVPGLLHFRGALECRAMGIEIDDVFLEFGI